MEKMSIRGRQMTVASDYIKLSLLITHNLGFNLNPLLSLTRANMPKIPQMRIDIESQIAFITPQIQRPSQHVHISSTRQRIVARSNVVLRRRVSVTQQRRRQLGHRISLMRNAVRLAL
jgi:hypothetical protein